MGEMRGRSVMMGREMRGRRCVMMGGRGTDGGEMIRTKVGGRSEI